MKPINYFLLALLLCSVIIASAPAPEYTIENNTVFINDSNVYLSATPHTLSSSGWVYFNLTTKTYTNDIDMAWGFNTSVSKPTKAELYSPHWVNTTSQHEHTFYNVSAFTVYTGTDFDYGNIYNTNYSYTATHEIVTYNESTMEPNGTDVIDSNVSFDSFVTDGTNYTVTWHTRHDSYVDWLDFSASFTALDYDHEGYNKWYYITHIPVVATTEYTMRAWVDVPVSLSETTGKYYVAVKPSSETIPESIAAGHFYALDPWWNSSWDYYKTHTLNQTMIDDAIGTGHYTLLVEYTDTDLITKAQADGDDIVFTSSANVSLPHQLSVFNSTTGYVKAFVGLSDITNVTSVNMYYGNSGATNTENKSGVWGVNASGIWLMDEGEGGYVNDSSGNGNNGTINGADWVADGLDFVTGNNDYITIGDCASLDISGDHTIIASINTSTNNIRQGIYGKYLSPTFSIRGAVGDSGELAYYNTNTGWKYSTASIDNNLFSSVGVVVDANAGGNFYIDGQDAGGSWVDATTGLTPNNNDAEIGRDYDNYRLNGILSYVYIYNRTLSADEIATTYNNTNQPLLFISTGTEQNQTAGDTTAPTYSGEGTNNTIAGQSTLFYIKYDDNTALHTNGQYIFSTNNTGTWVNETAVNFTATPQYANKTITLNSTVGVPVGYRWYGTDNATNEGNTPIYTVTTTSAGDTTAPTYSNVAHSTVEAGTSCTFSIQYNDDTALHTAGQYIFATNTTGTWTNESAVNFTATPQYANKTKTLPTTHNQVSGYRWYTTDNAGNTNDTPIYTLTVQDTVPPLSTTGLTNATGNFWHNWTWSNPAADFNHTTIYINGVHTVNTSLEYYNLTASAHNQSTISIKTVDAAGNVNATWTNHTSIISNNAVTITNVSSTYSLNEGETLSIDADYTDVDNDVGTFDDNSSEWSINSATGVVEWITTGTDSGTYNYEINVTDGYGSTDTKQFTVTVNNTIYPPIITLTDYYGLDSTGARVNTFNTTGLEEIEKMVLNFSISSGTAINDWYFNFTANGTNGCSLGNKQSDNCYNYSNAYPYQWIQFVNNTDTATFDATTGNAGDSITVSQSGSGNQIYVNLTIDEHYNPNVFKWYEGLLDFNDVKWQTGTNQVITKNNMLKIDVNTDLVPLNADQYKLDFRVNYTQGALEPVNRIRAFACNDNYVTGDPGLTSNCVIVAAKYPSELQDDGTKFRAIFTKNLIDGIGNISSIVLESDDVNPSRYYYIKTYKATETPYTTHWNYSTDSGDTWTNTADGYETELNINWFYDGVDNTAFVYQMYANTSTMENTTTGDIDWSIEASQNYPPLVYIYSPIPNENVELPYTSNFSTSDTNDDELNVSMMIYQNNILYQTIFTGLNQTNTSYLIDGIPAGDYQLILWANETLTTELYNVSSIRNITIVSNYIPPDPVSLTNTTTGMYIKHSWAAGSGNVTDSYNVSQNGTWTNGTTLTYFNTSVPVHGWSNITVWAYNVSHEGTLSSASVSQNTQLPNNPITITNTSNWSGNEGEQVYLDFDYTDADGDIGTFATNTSNGNLNTATGVYTWNTVDGDQGTYSILFNVTDGYTSVSAYTATVTIGDSTPTATTNIQNSTSGLQITWNWTAGLNGDYTEVNINDTWKENSIDTEYIYTALPHSDNEIQTRTYNATLAAYSAYTNQTTTLPNNPVTLSGIPDTVTNEDTNLTAAFDLDNYYTDLDGDTGTFQVQSNNDTANLTVTIQAGNTVDFNVTAGWTGAALVTFNATDGYGSTDTDEMTLSIGNVSANLDNFTFSNTTVTPVTILSGKTSVVTIDVSDPDGTINTAIIRIRDTNHTMSHLTGNTWTYTHSETSYVGKHYITYFYAQDNASAWNSTASTAYIEVLKASGEGGGAPYVPPIKDEVIPEEQPQENITVNGTTIINKIETLLTGDPISIFRFNFFKMEPDFAKRIYAPDVTGCTIPESSEVVSCFVEGNGYVTIISRPELVKIYGTREDYVVMTINGATYNTAFDITILNFMGSVPIPQTQTYGLPDFAFYYDYENGTLDGIRLWFVLLLLIIGICISYLRITGKTWRIRT